MIPGLYSGLGFHCYVSGCHDPWSVQWSGFPLLCFRLYVRSLVCTVVWVSLLCFRLYVMIPGLYSGLGFHCYSACFRMYVVIPGLYSGLGFHCYVSCCMS